MNKKVLKTMIALVLVFLVALYVVKIFFPEQFVMSVENEHIVAIGNFIDSHWWARCVIGVVIGIIFDYLYFGAVGQRTKLHWLLIVFIILYNVAYSLFIYLAPIELVLKLSNILVCISVAYMIIVPIFLTKKLVPLAVTYVVNYMSQALSLEIRNIGLLLVTSNSITMMLMSVECYLWVLLCFMLFNYKKEDKNNGTL